MDRLGKTSCPRNVRRTSKKLYNPTAVHASSKRSLVGMLTRRGDNGTEKQDWLVNFRLNHAVDYPIAAN